MGWCEYGRRRSCRTSITARSTRQFVEPPDYRVTCFFVDKRYRRQRRVHSRPAGRPGADRAGGRRRRRGVSQDTANKQITASFLYNGTRSLFEEAGFTYDRPKGKNHCVMITTIAPASSVEAPAPQLAKEQP